MGKRILGLIGAGSGPWIDCSQLVEPHAKVTGMDAGSIEVHTNETASEEGSEIVGRIDENGVHRLRRGRFMRVVAKDCRIATVCTFVSR